MRYKNLTKCLSLFAIGILIILIIFYNMQTPQKHTKNAFALNTYITVTVYGENAEALAQAAVKTVTDAEKVFSAHLPTAELYRLNEAHETDVPYPVSDELFSVLSLVGNLLLIIFSLDLILFQTCQSSQLHFQNSV